MQNGPKESGSKKCPWVGKDQPKTGKQKDHAQIHRLARIPKRAISHDHNRGLVGVDTCTGAAEGEKPEKFG